MEHNSPTLIDTNYQISTPDSQALLEVQLQQLDHSAKIYVAGHRGMVGSAIVRQLRHYGFHNLLLRTHEQLDLTDQAQVWDLFAQERPDYVFLAAAKVGGIVANNTYRADFIYENSMIQANVIHASYKFQVKKLIFLGSSCIYPKNCPQPIKETYLLTSELEDTNQPYALAKITGIEMCWSYNRQYGTNFVALMPTNLYGIGDNYHPQNSHVIPALIRKAHLAKLQQHESMEVWGTGTVLREFITSDQMAQASLFIFSLPDDKLQPYLNDQEPPIFNVGIGKDQTIKEICELICKVVGYQGKLVFDPSKPDGTYRKLLDVSKLRQLGWQATDNLEAGLAIAYQDFVAHHYQPYQDIYQVILCGGVGSRLWPISNTEIPKQFSTTVSSPTLFELTIARLKAQYPHYVIITNQNYLNRVIDTIAHQQDNRFDILLEPTSRNTAPAINCATKYISDNYGDQLILILPSDHLIEDEAQFQQAIAQVKDYAINHDVIVTFGIKPTVASTKYGYIQKGTAVASQLYSVQQFHEKPHYDLAQSYFAQGNYLWNAGIFLFKASTYLKLLQQVDAPMAQQTQLVMQQTNHSSKLQANISLTHLDSSFQDFINQSVDYAILEKASNIVVYPLDLIWSDMGSWEAIYQHSKSDQHKNVLLGNCFCHNISNTYIKAEQKPIFALGVHDLVIIDTEDLILVSHKDEIERANTIVKQLIKHT